jgi:hypothetical protein
VLDFKRDMVFDNGSSCRLLAAILFLCVADSMCLEGVGTTKTGEDIVKDRVAEPGSKGRADVGMEAKVQVLIAELSAPRFAWVARMP